MNNIQLSEKYAVTDSILNIDFDSAANILVIDVSYGYNNAEIYLTGDNIKYLIEFFNQITL